MMFVFTIFHCPQLLYCPTCLTSLGIRGVQTQVFSSPTPVLFKEVTILILIRILFATQYEIRILKKSC